MVLGLQAAAHIHNQRNFTPPFGDIVGVSSFEPPIESLETEPQEELKF